MKVSSSPANYWCSYEVRITGKCLMIQSLKYFKWGKIRDAFWPPCFFKTYILIYTLSFFFSLSVLNELKVCTFLLLRTENKHLFMYIHSSTYQVDTMCTGFAAACLGTKNQTRCLSLNETYIPVKKRQKPMNKISTNSDMFCGKKMNINVSI